MAPDEKLFFIVVLCGGVLVLVAAPFVIPVVAFRLLKDYISND